MSSEATLELSIVSDGKPTGITQSDTEPVEKYDGMLWQYTGAEDLPVTGTTAVSGATYVISDDSWSAYELPKENINIDKVEDISKVVGKVGNIFEYNSPDGHHAGTITFENGILITDEVGNSKTTINLVSTSSGQGLETTYYPDKNDVTKFRRSWYTPFSIYFSDSINKWTGSIAAENLAMSPWTNLTLLSGFTVGDGVQPQYRRIKNLDGSYSVQFRGAVSPTSGNFPGSQVQVASLSGNYLPQTNTFVQGSDNTGRGGRVATTTDGKLYILAPNNSSYMYINSLTYYN